MTNDKISAAEQSILPVQENIAAPAVQETFIDEQLQADYWKEQDKTEKERIRSWKMKQAKIQSPITYVDQVIDLPDGKKEVKIEVQLKRNSRLSSNEQLELANAAKTAITGSASSDYNSLFMNQTLNAMVTPESITYIGRINAMEEILLSMNPADEFEAMLCRKIFLLDNHAVDILTKAKNSKHPETAVKYYTTANKLMARHEQALEALNRHRRKGEQKVTVTHNHVTVNDGGKAVVGPVNTNTRGAEDSINNEG